MEVEGGVRWLRVTTSVLKPEAMPAHRHEVLVVGVHLGQALAQAAHQGVDGLLGDAAFGRVGPDRAHDVIAADDAGRVDDQLQQPILLRRERRLEQSCR